MRFFPYESVHASDAFIKIKDTDHSWYNAIADLLSKYEPCFFHNCPPGYFALKMDNKITLEIIGNTGNTTGQLRAVYITYWDNTVYISDVYHRVNTIGKEEKYCTVQRKETNAFIY